MARSWEIKDLSAPLSMRAVVGVERGPSVTATRILDVEVDVAMARVELVVAARVVLIARRERLSLG